MANRVRTVDPRDEALRGLIALFTKENPAARSVMLREAIDDAIELDPHNDPMAVALSMLGQIQYDAETLASYIKFAVQQSGARGAIAGFGAAESGPRVNGRLRTAINEQLRQAGFDGNGRFDSIGKAIMAVNDVLENHGVSVPMISADVFRQRPGGIVALPIVDMGSGDEIANSVLSFGYHDHGSEHRAFEVVAYLS